MLKRKVSSILQATIVALSVMLASSSAIAGWFSMATHSNGSWGTSINKPSKNAAIKEALDTCKKYAKANCTTFATENADGFYAVARSPSYLHLTHSVAEDDARTTALNSCAANTPDTETCKIEWVGVMSSAKPAAQRKQSVATNDCRPRTNQLRCTFNCTNGNCIVTYENNCKMRVQVNPRFDPFSNQWTYPNPSC